MYQALRLHTYSASASLLVFSPSPFGWQIIVRKHKDILFPSGRRESWLRRRAIRLCVGKDVYLYTALHAADVLQQVVIKGEKNDDVNNSKHVNTFRKKQTQRIMEFLVANLWCVMKERSCRDRAVCSLIPSFSCWLLLLSLDSHSLIKQRNVCECCSLCC